jgi:cell fate regulator YaaT (PSP1 superfamily)
VELGEVVVQVAKEPHSGCITAQRLAEFLDTSGPEYPFSREGKILRVANPQDVIDYRHLESSAREERAYCRQQIRELELPMKLISAEHLLGGERIVFYFTAEARVDFRELVRRLAAQYRTRIEMRQVGARDEARLVGDYERCGQRCCCQEFLKYLKPVSMRMAKTQKATLDPAKISGRCGRLMCCLRYEDTCYEELRKDLPPKNTWVRTKELVGKVVETQILTQLVKLMLPDKGVAVISTEEIIERDVSPSELPQELPEPKPPEALPEPIERLKEPPPLPEPAPVEAAPEEPADLAPPDEPKEGLAPSTPLVHDRVQMPSSQKKKRRRRRRPKRPQLGPGQPKGSQQPSERHPPQAQKQQDAKQSGRQKRRRRKKRR